MSSIGTIRKTVGRSLEKLSPFQRLERLRQNAAPFTKNNMHVDTDPLIVRKTVGATR